MKSLVICILLCLPALLLATKFDATAAIANYTKEHPYAESDQHDCVIPNAEGLKFGPLNAIRDKRLRWTSNTLYYQFQGRFSADEMSKIRRAAGDLVRMTSYGGRMCINIVENNWATNRVVLRNCGNNCNSYVGMIGGQQQMCMAPWCAQERGSVIHEFLHALGFNHEHQRYDRDSHVYINYRNIQPRWYSAFSKLTAAQVDLLNTRYDYGSLMHYGAYSSFAINQRQPVIIPRVAGARIGQRLNPSAIDIERVQILYGCRRAADSVYFKHLDGLY